jgi:hypothetical protein
MMGPRLRAASAIRQHSGLIAVGSAVALGILMRVAGWTWGFPEDLHPDEWVIVQGALDLVHRKSFEPHMYYRPDHVEIQLSYIGYTLYSHLFLNMPVEGGYAKHPDHFLLISRAITTIFGIAMIVLAYLIGKRVHRAVGMIAAVLFALFPPFVENSQYATPDVPLTAALMLVILASMMYLEKPQYRSLLVACAATSVGIAIKYPGALATLTIAVVIIYAGIRDRAWLRIPRDGVVAIVAVIFFLFVISPVLFTNAHAVIKSLTDESGDTHLGADVFGWDGNVEFYAHSYLLWAGVIVTVLSVVGLVMAVRLRLVATIPWLLSLAYWLLLSILPLHWPRWGLPMFVAPLLLAAVAAYYGYRWLRERGTLGRWLTPLVSVLAVVALGNMVMNSEPVATRAFVEDSRISMQPTLEKLGVTTKNSIYEGYSPLLPGAPKAIFDEVKVVDGRVLPVDPARRFVVLSHCMMQRYLVNPSFTSEQHIYRLLEEQAPMVAKVRVPEGWAHSSVEPVNMVRAPEKIVKSLEAGTSGCDIDVRRLVSP